MHGGEVCVQGRLVQSGEGLGEASERRGTHGKEGLDLRNFVKESTGCGLCGQGQADRFTDAVT